jgi:FkbM family methyltransferase
MGEQKIILNYFGENKGVFLDIGANDGIKFSNTYALALNGWQGVSIEPDNGAYSALCDNIKNLKGICFKCCIGTENKLVDFFISDDSLLCTLLETEKKKWINNKFTKTKVEMITFARLQEISGYNKFDFINIDAEGVDYEILTQIDLTDTKMLCIEVNERQRKQYIDYCTKYNMKLISDTGINLIFSK